MWEGVETQSKSKKTTNQRIKTNKKEHKILNIYAYLSIILMQQYSLFSSEMKTSIHIVTWTVFVSLNIN